MPGKKFDDFGAGSFEDELKSGMWGGAGGMGSGGAALPDDEEMPEELDDFGDNGLESCEECGAPEGQPCDPECPNAGDIEGVDPDTDYDTRFEAVDKASGVEPGAGNHTSDCECPSCEGKAVNESNDFDRFMNRILSEETKKGMSVLNDSPHRKRALREQERPMGRTRIGGK